MADERKIIHMDELTEVNNLDNINLIGYSGTEGARISSLNLKKDIVKLMPSVPSKLSQLNNDTGFITEEDLPTKVSDLENDSGFVTEDVVPTKVSDLVNDKSYVTQIEMSEDTISIDSKQTSSESAISFDSDELIPTSKAVKQFVSENTFSSEDLAKDSDSTEEFNRKFYSNDKPTAGLAVKRYIQSAGVAFQEDLPPKVSDLENDSNFVTEDAVPTKVGDLENDSGYIPLVTNTRYKAIIGDKSYEVVKIGNQLWLIDNLDYVFNGLKINPSGPSETYNAAWYYNNSSDYSHSGKYKCGLLYSKTALANLKNNVLFLPSGWHIPNRSDYVDLINYINGEHPDEAAITYLKAKNYSIAEDFPTNWNGTDSYGFKAIPSGIRNYDSTYSYDDFNSKCYLAYYNPSDGEYYSISIDNNEIEFDNTIENLYKGVNVRLVMNLNSDGSIPSGYDVIKYTEGNLICEYNNDTNTLEQMLPDGSKINIASIIVPLRFIPGVTPYEKIFNQIINGGTFLHYDGVSYTANVYTGVRQGPNRVALYNVQGSAVIYHIVTSSNQWDTPLPNGARYNFVDLNTVTYAISDHDSDTSAHSNLKDMILAFSDNNLTNHNNSDFAHPDIRSSITDHNNSSSAHSDIRSSIENLSRRMTYYRNSNIITGAVDFGANDSYTLTQEDLNNGYISKTVNLPDSLVKIPFTDMKYSESDSYQIVGISVLGQSTFSRTGSYSQERGGYFDVVNHTLVFKNSSDNTVATCWTNPVTVHDDSVVDVRFSFALNKCSAFPEKLTFLLKFNDKLIYDFSNNSYSNFYRVGDKFSTIYNIRILLNESPI